MGFEAKHHCSSPTSRANLVLLNEQGKPNSPDLLLPREEILRSALDNGAWAINPCAHLAVPAFGAYFSDLRQIRATLGFTITTAALELGLWPSKISLLERGRIRDDDLAAVYRQWLTKRSAKVQLMA